MCWTIRAGWLAAAISIAAAAVPTLVSADQSTCQANAAGPLGNNSSTAGGVNVHVTADNSVYWCSAALIEANSDIPDGTNYPEQATNQSPNYNPVSNAISVSHLLTLAGVTPSNVDHTAITRSNGTSSTLDNADLVDPSSSFQGGLSPIFWINGSETQYLRPLRGPTDTNGDDAIVASGGDALDIYVYSGPLLDVIANATPTSATIGKSVTFTARVSNPSAADGTLTYKWNFDDGSSAAGATVTHRFSAIGSYDAVASVQGAGNDSGGTSPPVSVLVGSPPKGGTGGSAGGTNGNQHAPSGGPAHSHGKTPTSAPGANNNRGSTHTNTSPSSSTPTPQGHHGPPSTTPSQAATPQPTTPAQATPTPTPTATTPHRPAPHPHHAAAARSRPAPQKPAQPPPTPEQAVVKGRLISDLIPVSAAQLAAQNDPTVQSSPQAHAPSARIGGGSLTPVGGIVGGCVIVLLLGSGAGLELRSQRRSMGPARSA
jgi:PKD domain